MRETDRCRQRRNGLPVGPEIRRGGITASSSLGTASCASVPLRTRPAGLDVDQSVVRTPIIVLTVAGVAVVSAATATADIGIVSATPSTARPGQVVRLHVNGYLPMHAPSMAVVHVRAKLMPRPSPCQNKTAICEPIVWRSRLTRPRTGFSASPDIGRAIERNLITPTPSCASGSRNRRRSIPPSALVRSMRPRAAGLPHRRASAHRAHRRLIHGTTRRSARSFPRSAAESSAQHRIAPYDVGVLPKSGHSLALLEPFDRLNQSLLPPGVEGLHVPLHDEVPQDEF